MKQKNKRKCISVSKAIFIKAEFTKLKLKLLKDRSIFDLYEQSSMISMNNHQWSLWKIINNLYEQSSMISMNNNILSLQASINDLYDLHKQIVNLPYLKVHSKSLCTMICYHPIILIANTSYDMYSCVPCHFRMDQRVFWFATRGQCIKGK